MNNEIIKHIIVCSWIWRKPVYLTMFILQFLVTIILVAFGLTDITSGLLLITGMFSGILLISPSPFSQRLNYQAGQQLTGFSWNYIHSVVHDRKSFIMGCIALQVVTQIPTMVFLTIIVVTLKQDLRFLMALISIPIVSSFMCIVQFSQTFMAITRISQAYHKNQFIRFFRILRSLFSSIIHGVIFLSVGYTSISFFSNYGWGYAFAAAHVFLILASVIVYNNILDSWADERLTKEKITRTRKKQVAYLLVSALFAFLTYNFFGYFPGSEKDIFEAIDSAKVNELKAMKLTRNDLSDTNSRYRTPLMAAIEANNLEMVKVLISKGAGLEDRYNPQDENENTIIFKGFTPLMFSISIGNLDIVKYLIEKGANVNASTDQGMSALSYATTACDIDALDVLVKAGANLNQPSLEGNTPLFFTGRGQGCLTSLLYLKKLGADVKVKNKKNQDYLEYLKASQPFFYRQYIFYTKNL